MAGALTQKRIEALLNKRPPKKLEEADGEGLYFVIGERTQKWMVRYRAPRSGENVKLDIGRYGQKRGELGLKAARDKARAVNEKVKAGVDPRIAEQAAKADDRLTENLLDAFLAEHVDKHNRRSTANQTRQFIDREIRPAWRGRLIGDIARDDIGSLVKRIAADRPVSAARVRALLSRFFRWCVEEEKIVDLPFRYIKVPTPAKSRDRVLTTEEIRCLWLAAETLKVPFAGLVRLLLMSGQRRDEAARARWIEFDLDAAEPLWTIPVERSKNGKPHLVPLAPQVVALLRRQAEWQEARYLEHEDLEQPAWRRDAPCPFVFSTDGRNPISGYSHIKEQLDAAMLVLARKEAIECGDDAERVTIPAWRFHDLRRTFVTISNERLGILPHIVEAVVNHVSGMAKAGVAGTYNRALYLTERRRALLAWADHLTVIVDGKTTADNVVPLRA